VKAAPCWSYQTYHSKNSTCSWIPSSATLHCLARGFSSHVLRTCRLKSDIRDPNEAVLSRRTGVTNVPDLLTGRFMTHHRVPARSLTQARLSKSYEHAMQGRCRKKAVWHAADGRRSRRLRRTPNMETATPDWLPSTSTSRQHPTSLNFKDTKDVTGHHEMHNGASCSDVYTLPIVTRG